jgi:hypothetical protein
MWVDLAALIIAVAIPLAVGFTGTAVGGGGQSGEFFCSGVRVEVGSKPSTAKVMGFSHGLV